MLTIAAASYVFVIIAMFWLLRIKFYPTYAAFTFPLVISAAVFRLVSNVLSENGIFIIDDIFNIIVLIANISTLIAIVIVVYVLAHYIRYFRFWLKF